MKIQIISIGKLSDDMEKISNHYQKMINWNVKNTEITYAKKPNHNQIKQYESKLIQEKLTKDSRIISLDLTGKQHTSEEFSDLIAKQMMIGKNIDFIIGGAFGLDQSILSLSHMKMSLSKMTLPHQMAKLMLVEQIYRSQTILDQHPYHK
jgi:23S rRNA (pseudouridine1915-N3)-methyltransferase